MEGFFKLRTAADLREKLSRDLEKLKAEPLSADAAFNFFVTAEHMLDWVYPRKANNAKRKEVRKKSVLLRLCSHLANGAKHFEVEHTDHNTALSTEMSSVSWDFDTEPRGFEPHGFEQRIPVLKVFLKNDAAKVYGLNIRVVLLAQKVMDHWAEQDLTSPPA